MEKDTKFFLIGSGVGLGGVGIQMTGAPHWVGWAILGIGACVAIFPWAAHQLNPDPESHASNDLRDAPKSIAPLLREMRENMRARMDARPVRDPFKEMRQAAKEATRTELAHKRADGVALRNAGINAIFSDDLWTAWRDSLTKWNGEVVELIGKISAADAKWFEILDTVPPPRIPMESIFAGDDDHHAYAMHDKRLVRLEELIQKYGNQ
jgi:hypothetical protein